MPRPRVNGGGKKKRMYQRVAVQYRTKQDVLQYMDEGHTTNEAILEFFGKLSKAQHRAKQQQISKWRTNAGTIGHAVESGRGHHANNRQTGLGTVLSSETEERIVQWINSYRKDGAPVSRLMLHLKAKEIASDSGVPDGQFAASDSWIRLFLRRHRLSLRARTRQGQTTPQDARDAAIAFQALVRQTIVEKHCVQVLNADQTAVFFEYVPKRTVCERGAKSVWVRSATKDKERATAMLLGDSSGGKYAPFILFKSTPARSASTQAANNDLRHGFGTRVWREVDALQRRHPCQIYGNKCAWWNSDLSLKFLEFHFADRPNRDENILLLWDDFSGHWTPQVTEYAASLNVILLKVPPRYTYVCQPADIAWNKPFKGKLRGRWLERLRGQLSAYNDGECSRQQQQEAQQDQIVRVQMDQMQEVAEAAVPALRDGAVQKRFAVTAPARANLVEWISDCWWELKVSTIIGGFKKAGLLNDTRAPRVEPHLDNTIEEMAGALERLGLVEEELDSDDDIGGGIEEEAYV